MAGSRPPTVASTQRFLAPDPGPFATTLVESRPALQRVMIAIGWSGCGSHTTN